MIITSKVNSSSSSCVSEAFYDTDTETLTITYPSGLTYDYQDVPKEVFDSFEAAPSAGRYLNMVIKPTYACI